jgi:UPF0148 protein
MKIKEDIKKMANLLRSGHTMLNISCPDCNNPLFKDKDGNMFCPICNKIALFEEPFKSDTLLKKQPVQEDLNNNDDPEILKMNRIIQEKINYIFQKLKEEDQIDTIQKYVSLLDSLLRLLCNLKNKD